MGGTPKKKTYYKSARIYAPEGEDCKSGCVGGRRPETGTKPKDHGAGVAEQQQSALAINEFYVFRYTHYKRRLAPGPKPQDDGFEFEFHFEDDDDDDYEEKPEGNGNGEGIGIEIGKTSGNGKGKGGWL